MDIDHLAISPRPFKRRKVAAMAARDSVQDLLSAWGAVKSPTSVSKMNRSVSGHGLRASNPAFTYAESPSSSTPPSPASAGKAADYEDALESQVDAAAQEQDYSDSEDELQSDENIVVAPRRTFIEQEERPRGIRDLPARSTRARFSYARPLLRSSGAGKTASRSKLILTSDTLSARRSKAKPKLDTARNRVRQDISLRTKPKRDAFLLAKKDYFLPLLPANNYIRKLERSEDRAADLPDEVLYRELSDQPAGVTADMKPYQLAGLSFLVHMYNNGMSCILGDEMGLGKTLQTLALFQYLSENQPAKGEHRPFLVVCPLSVLSSWITESKKWVPDMKVLRFHGPKAERKRIMKDCMDHTSRSRTIATLPDIVVTTYETFKAEQGWFKRVFVWRYCVLDEGHMVKNEKSDISAALHGLSAEFRLLLTGTPLQNNLKEMWALLHWLFPAVFDLGTEDNFRQAFDLTKGKVSTSFMDSSRRLLELIMLRRMKSSPEVNLGLPPKEEVLLFVPLTPGQRFWYTRLLTRESKTTLEELFLSAKDKEIQAKRSDDDEQLKLLERAGAALSSAEGVAPTDVWAESRAVMQEALEPDSIGEEASAWKKLMNLLMQLRKVCNHPYLLPNVAPREYTIGDHVKHASGKFIVLDKLLDELVLKQRKKILIFSGFTKTLDLVSELLQLKGANSYNAPFQFDRLDGGTSRAQRNLAIRMFNDKDSDYQVMLLSTRAGGLGINLTSATEVVFMDEDWNPQVTIQAEARAHRIGQTQKVTIYKLCSSGTVEEQMLGRIRKKLYLSAKITESMRNIHGEGPVSKKRKRESSIVTAEDDTPHMDTASLQSLIRRGAQTLARPEIDINEMLKWDWDTVLENCKDKPVDISVSDAQGNEYDEQKWLNSMERVETAIFEGKKHEKELERKETKIVELSRKARRAGKNTTVEIDGFMISKESMNCADWEAVPTFAGKDPRLAEPKKQKKEAIEHQEFCQTCWDGGDLVLCHGCPRAYHHNCLSSEQKARSATWTFYCPQHECRDCGSKTSEAGGLIFRCRWCENGFCEDCLDWTTANRVGYTLPEFEMRGFGYRPQAFFVDCHRCVQHFEKTPEDRLNMENEKLRYDQEYQEWLDDEDDVKLVDSTSGANRTPDTISEAVTPANLEFADILEVKSPAPRSSTRKKARKS